MTALTPEERAAQRRAKYEAENPPAEVSGDKVDTPLTESNENPPAEVSGDDTEPDTDYYQNDGGL